MAFKLKRTLLNDRSIYHNCLISENKRTNTFFRFDYIGDGIYSIYNEYNELIRSDYHFNDIKERLKNCSFFLYKKVDDKG